MRSLAEQVTQSRQQHTSRRGFLAGISKLLLGGMILPVLSLDPVTTHAAAQRSSQRRFPMNKPDLLLVSTDSASIAGEPLAYPNTPSPEISSYMAKDVPNVLHPPPA
jgi:hypothetical protein